MSDNETRVRELLACHGSDVGQWPVEDRPLWFEAQRRPKLSALIEEEMQFERILLKRGVPSPSRDFTSQIINASLARPQAIGGFRWLSDLLPQVRPSALAAMLVLGFAIGFGMVSHTSAFKNAAVVKAYTDDDSTIL